MAGVVKAFNLPIEYVLYDMSYANAILYCACLPSYDSKASEKSGDEHYDGDDVKTNEIIQQLAFTSD